MTTALRPTRPKPKPRQQASRRPRSHLQTIAPVAPAPLRHPIKKPPLAVVPNSPARPPVRQLPTRRPLPTWLRLLIQLQRGSVIVTFVLVTAALVVYGSTIYMQQHWSKEYRKLKTMQRSERQMIAAGELMKNQLIQQAEQPGSGLVPRTSEHTIVLEPSPSRARVAPTTPPVVTNVEPAAAPLGY
ncbi:MAG: hypothetical protein IGS48_15350 [Oscillatoriales cyanobacterium C42_A2020_001]|nr:hypothetical protein [Leptolyngbyaceae cyanobacterium C42_A2020_001]